MKKGFLLFITHYLLSTILIGCTTIYNPATGKKEILFINTAQEIAIGRNVAKEVLKKNKVLEDEQTQKYVREIGERISSVSDRKDAQYSFTVLDNKGLNAFALPGGKVYINKGLLDKLDEDEIACILAHEVGHIAARHAAKRIQGQLGYQLLTTVAIYSVRDKDRRVANAAVKSANSIFQLILLGYSRKDELLADKLAIKYAHRAGYNPYGMVSGLKKLKKHGGERKLWRPLVILRSHPYLSDRILAAEAEAGMVEGFSDENEEDNQN